MAMKTMCTFPSAYHALPHCKCVLFCCDKCPIIVIHSQESNRDSPHICPTMRFHVYRNISCCKFHGRLPHKYRTTCSMCFTMPSSDTTDKVHTSKELVLLEKFITEVREKFYIPAIQKISFRFPHVRIFATHHCGK